MEISRKKMTLIVAALMIPMLLFAAVLNTLSFRRTMAEAYVHADSLNMVGMVRKLNYAISFGKPVEKFYGMEELLQSAMELSDSIRGIEVRDMEGNAVKAVGESVGDVQREYGGSEYRIEKEAVYFFEDFDAGQIVVRLDSGRLAQQTKDYAGSVFFTAAALVITVLVLLGLFFFFWRRQTVPFFYVKRVCIGMLLGAQVCFGVTAMYFGLSSYQNSVRLVAENVAHVVEEDINEVIKKGISYDELEGVDEYLDDILGRVTELSDISVQNNEAPARRNAGVYSKRADVGSIMPTYILCVQNGSAIGKKVFNQMIDILILVLVSVFVGLEAVHFLTGRFVPNQETVKGEFSLSGFRLFVFVSGAAFSLDCGFISVFSSKLYGAMELPEAMSFLSGMPNTMFSAAVAVGLFTCSFFISKLGIKGTMKLGVCMGILGYILCALTANLPMLIAARFVFGFCDGLVLNTIRLYASSQPDPAMHNKLLATYFAAINLGVCCSVVIGGLVADVIGYRAVFILGAILGIFTLALLPAEGFSAQKSSSGLSFGNALKELMIPQVFIFMVFMVVPIYIATLFVGYTFPLFGDEAGLSNSLVSGCLMVNYLLVAYLTDPLSVFIMRHMSPKTASVFYVLLQTASIGCFVIMPSIITALSALVLTSIWDSFGMVVIDSVLDNMEGTTASQNTLLQMICGKVGMVAGPMIVTARLSGGAAAATAGIVAVLGAGLLIFLLFGGTRKQERTGYE